MRDIFTLSVKTINGEVKEHPVTISFNCNKVLPLGVMEVRYFDANYCIKVVRVFMIQQGTNLYGTQLFFTSDGFKQYFNTHCQCCLVTTCCDVLYNGCYVTINGKRITIGRQSL